MDFQLNLQTETVDHAGIADSINLEPTTTVREAFHRLRGAKTGAVLIWSKGQLAGIFTERDALRLMAAKSDLDVPLENHMARNPVTLSTADTVGAAITKMARGGYRRLPIVDQDGNANGMLKVSGILHYLVSHFPTVVYNLPPSPNHTTQQREGA